MDQAAKHNTSFVIRWIARLFALAVTLFMARVYFSEFAMVTSRLASPPFSWQTVWGLFWIIGLGGLIVGGYMVSWKWERLGATLFVIASIGVLVRESLSPIAWHPSVNHYVPWAVAMWIDWGLPLLGAGILFFISSQLSRNANVHHNQPAI